MRPLCAVILLSLIAISPSAFAATRYTFKEPIPSDVRAGDYVCKNFEDLQTIYSVTTLFHGEGAIGRQVAQRFIDRDLCYIIQQPNLKAQVTGLEVSEDPSGISGGYFFALATFTLADGSAISAWSHMKAFPELSRRDAELFSLISKKTISGSNGYILDNRKGGGQ